MAYTAWSVIAGEVPTETKWNTLGDNDADFDERLLKIEEDLVIATDGATVTFNLADGRAQYVELGGNRTFALSGNQTGMRFMIIINHDGGVRTPVWWANIDWEYDVEPTPGTGGAGSYDAYGFVELPDGHFLGVIISQGNKHIA